MFPKQRRNYTFYQNSGALLIAIFGALSVADYIFCTTGNCCDSNKKNAY